ncbi:hypothetical protein TUM19329_34080 [Legionella antarctica]|uniref:Transmembrane protein n=1 Tax=Legionella antarctica TaxID=2708020 RepID=A0A6F8TAA1_9GAMM|nr:hypothetical protein [Legionella antarctica]BCA97047.1 hypothetical protein TUM19329_34080 [Legionella antarctica]
MWRLIQEWYKTNQVSLGIVVGASIGMGVISASTCLFFPSALFALSALTFLGVTPLFFLTTMNLPLAVLTVATIMTGVTFGAITVGVLVMKQLIHIGRHVWGLCSEEKPQQDAPLIDDTYSYLNAHLQKRDSYTPQVEIDDEFIEISSSIEEAQESSTCSYNSTTEQYYSFDNSIPYASYPSLS